MSVIIFPVNHAPPELVDNRERYVHAEALRWLAENRAAPLSVASGYGRLGGLVALASLPGPQDRPIRLLLGAVPEPGLGADPAEEPKLAGDRFRETLERLRRERDFGAFPVSRRILEEFGGVIYADGVGTGKTEFGVRSLEEYARERGSYALIVTPAQLRETLWEKRRDEAGLPGQVVSYQELAADRQLGPGTERRLHLNEDACRLVVEARALRNADNTWYAALGRLLGGRRRAWCSSRRPR